MIDVQLARTRQQLDRCLAMRRTVFTEELGVPPEVDVDGHDVLDGECLHFLVTDGGRDIGAIRCTPQEDGTVRLQRFCIHKDSRSHGAGRLTAAVPRGILRREGIPRPLPRRQVLGGGVLPQMRLHRRLRRF